ncbi:MAG: 5-formyltetrahydrofolate cyclo-ligase [Pyrinomonadaceae bacterium]|nr:5-formyltetrahydrofolate cyclo-ligase [Pyrinomonadaceae bacterium]
MLKSELRKIYLEKQKSLSDAERSEKSRRIAEQFFAHFDLTNIRFLHVFLPIEKNREIDTFIIINRLRRDFPRITTIVPRLDFETMTLENLKFDAAKLAVNQWHIPEPIGGESVVGERIDAVLAPLLCFDNGGFRVGYGKGFYDKLLKTCRADCLKIGLSYFASVAEISDAQSFDIKLDFCVMPEEVFTVKT